MVKTFRLTTSKRKETIPLKFDDKDLKILKSNEKASFELRSIRLGGEQFKHVCPNFWIVSVPEAHFKKWFDLPEREQSK